MDTYQAIFDGVRSKISNCDVSQVLRDVLVQQMDFGAFIQRLNQEMYNVSAEMQRPSVLYRPGLSIDGNMWCALYGDNIQDECAGFGASPQGAMHDFDVNWSKSKQQ